MAKITSKTTLQEILNLSKSEEILAQYKVPCLTCPMAKFEMEDLTIGDICKMYSINEKELLDELNKIAK